MLPPGRGKLADKAAANRIGNRRENNRDGARLLQQCGRGGCGVRKNEVGLQRDEFFRELSHQVRFSGRRPASVNPNVATLRPPEFVKSVPERRDIALCLRIAFGKAHQHADPPHPLRLLRARR
jgi:hypothetical protein